MAIPDEDVAQVRAATDIATLIGEYTPLKRVGQRYVGLCPFHAEKSASFSVNAEQGLYYCFGCQASGDAITFLRAIEGCDFVEAVERLAARVGIAVRHEAGGRGHAEREQQQQLKEAMRRAVAFYHERLISGPDATRARQYLRSRGYDGNVVRQFRLGWAPDRGSHLTQALRMPQDVVVNAGLIHVGEYGPQDTFRGRVIFPIFDPAGDPIALGGRILPGGSSAPPSSASSNDPTAGGDRGERGRPTPTQQGPKYRNSKETPIYSKRRTLYGLNWARQGIVQSGEIIICEGYTDVIGFFTAGIPRAVATCGTALTDEHFRVIARFAKRVVLAFDADSAGQSAASRFYEWERRDDVQVSVAALPPGSDPGELARTNPEQLRAAVEGVMPFLGFRVDRALTSGDLRAPEGRAKAAEAAVAMIAEHPDNALIRDQYLVTIADKTRIDVERLRELVDRIARENRGDRPAPGVSQRHRAFDRDDEPIADNWEASDDWEASATGSRSGTGSRSNNGNTTTTIRSGSANRTPGQRAAHDALILAVHEPEAMAAKLDEVLFADPTQKAAYLALAGSPNLHEAIEGASDDAAQLLRELAVSEPEANADQTIVALVRASAVRVLRDLESDARNAEAAGNAAGLLAAGESIAWLKPKLELMQETGVTATPPRIVIEAADRLLGWLISRRMESA